MKNLDYEINEANLPGIFWNIIFNNDTTISVPDIEIELILLYIKKGNYLFKNTPELMAKRKINQVIRDIYKELHVNPHIRYRNPYIGEGGKKKYKKSHKSRKGKKGKKSRKNKRKTKRH